MSSQVRSTKQFSVNSQAVGLIAMVTSLILLGLFFRFIHLDHKLYWVDEVFTSLQLSGHTLSEMKQQLIQGQVISIETLHQYQYPRPDGTVLDPVRVLLAEDSHVPLYYVMLWHWVKTLGNSIATIRSFSAVLSLLVFPAIYWICRELFQSALSGWLAIALVAISPLHVLYAQEARPYCLFILMVLLAGAAFLRAMRLRTVTSWAIYAIAAMAGLYSHSLFPFVLLAHGIYSLGLEKFSLRRIVRSQAVQAYCGAIAPGFVAYGCWFWLRLKSLPDRHGMAWTDTGGNLISTLVRWVGIGSRTFLDVGIGPEDGMGRMVWLILPISLLCLLVASSFWLLYKRTPPRTWLFILTLTVIPALALVVPDFFMGLRYGTTRYLIPSLLGIQLAMVYLLSSQLERSGSSNRSGNRSDHQSKLGRARLWQIIPMAIALAGVFSCTMSVQAQIWWSKSPERHLYVAEAAEIIDQSKHPLIVSDADIIDIQVLGHLLHRQNAEFLLVPSAQSPRIPPEIPLEIPADATDIFLFKPSDSLRASLAQPTASKLERLVQPLWQLSRPTPKKSGATK